MTAKDSGTADLQIGEVAERTGVTQRTLRFYEEKGLLNPATRMEGGFRLYTETDVQRVEQIKRLKSLLGLSLAEIKEMVDAQESLEQIRAEYRKDAEVDEKLEQLHRAMRITEAQRSIIQQKLEQLGAMNEQLEKRLQSYHTWQASLEAQRQEPAPLR